MTLCIKWCQGRKKRWRAAATIIAVTTQLQQEEEDGCFFCCTVLWQHYPPSDSSSGRAALLRSADFPPARWPSTSAFLTIEEGAFVPDQHFVHRNPLLRLLNLCCRPVAAILGFATLLVAIPRSDIHLSTAQAGTRVHAHDSVNRL